MSEPRVIVMVASQEVMGLVRKILAHCKATDGRNWDVQLGEIEHCAQCIVDIAGYDVEAFIREQRDPRSLK